MPLPRRPFLGLELAAPARAGKGLPVVRVLPGSMAEAAGLAAGDRLDALGEGALASLDDVAPAARAIAADTRARLAWRGAGSETPREATVDLIPLPGEHIDSCHVAYDEVEVDGARLRTIVSWPKRPGPHPALLLVQGMDRGTVDCWWGSDGAPLAALVHGFAERGFATLRLDKPGVGDSEGPADGGFFAEVRAFAAAHRALAALPFVDESRLFVFGHSVGGMVVPLLDGAAPLAGAVVHGTSARRFRDCMLDSVVRQAALRGLSGAALDERRALQSELHEAFYGHGLPHRAIVEERPALHVLSDPRFGRSAAYVRELDAVDLTAAWERFARPVLSLHGELDWVVEAAEARAPSDIARRAGQRADHRELPGTDHLFGRHPSREASFAALGHGRFASDLVDSCVAWLRS